MKTIVLSEANLKDYCSVREAAKRIGIKEGTLRQDMRMGLFVRYKFNSAVLMSVKEVEDFVKYRRR